MSTALTTYIFFCYKLAVLFEDRDIIQIQISGRGKLYHF